jgi:hypothetical protein
MGAGHLVRPLVAAAIAGSTACSIWAAIDDPYKSDTVSTGDTGPDSGGGGRAVDAGFAPYAIAARGDTVYVLDDHAAVHVAYDAGTSFETFWVSDAGDTVTTKNGIAVSDAGVFWTVDKGIRYCALDGGACGLMTRASPAAVAASDSMVAWIDGAGIGRCSVPVAHCPPAPIPLPNVPSSLAVAEDGTVAWVLAQSKAIHVDGPGGRGLFPLDYQVDVIAADLTTNKTFYWEGQSAIGFLTSDELLADAGNSDTIAQLTSGAPPNQLFAANGVAYWAFTTSNPYVALFSSCRFDSGAGCVFHPLPAGSSLVSKRAVQGVVATSRQVMAVLTSPTDMNQPELLVWPNPYAPPSK